MLSWCAKNIWREMHINKNIDLWKWQKIAKLDAAVPNNWARDPFSNSIIFKKYYTVTLRWIIYDKHIKEFNPNFFQLNLKAGWKDIRCQKCEKCRFVRVKKMANFTHIWCTITFFTLKLQKWFWYQIAQHDKLFQCKTTPDIYIFNQTILG